MLLQVSGGSEVPQREERVSTGWTHKLDQQEETHMYVQRLWQQLQHQQQQQQWWQQ